MFGKDRGEKTRLDLNELVRGVLAVMHAEMESQQISQQIDLSDGVSQVMGDRVSLQQVFLNLIMNAIEAMAVVTFSVPDKMSSFSVILFPALPSHFPDGRASVPGPQPYLPFGWVFPFAAGFQGCAMRRIRAVATPEAREAACRASATRADARAAVLAPVIAEIRACGITEPYAVAAALTARGVPTARGHRFWWYGSVNSLLRRLDRLPAVGTSQIESRATPLPGKPTAWKRKRKPVTRKALLSPSGLRSALRELS
jgi:hypothetical protein